MGGRALVLLAVVGGVAFPSAANGAADCPAATVQVLETAPPGKPHRLALAHVELRLTDPKGKVVATARPKGPLANNLNTGQCSSRRGRSCR